MATKKAQKGKRPVRRTLVTLESVYQKKQPARREWARVVREGDTVKLTVQGHPVIATIEKVLSSRSL